MQYKEVKMDLFKMPEEYYLAHCISSDLKMGKGIAVEFEKRFDIRKRIDKRHYDKYPACILINKVFNLVTKNKYWDKPSYKDLILSLKYMRSIVLKHQRFNSAGLCDNITKIAMPKIGCGLDRLKWEEVREIIKDIFKDVDIEIVICYI